MRWRLVVAWVLAVAIVIVVAATVLADHGSSTGQITRPVPAHKAP